ncbi:hypothetical protein CK507_09485 [Pseudomonas sp. WN033]|nr:hypothetical protein CK507_09485 [Pseudomonas sp. WN033]
MNITGIGSGLDINSMVKAIMDAERAPKAASLSRLESKTTAQFSALGQFRSAISDFQTALKNLNDSALFQKRTATSSNTDYFTATATSSAAAGNYSVQVFNLAQSSKVALAGFDSATTQVGTGELNITVGDEVINVQIGEDKQSLSAIRDAINAAGADKGLSAAIVNDPSGVGGARIVLTSTNSGSGNDIQVDVANATGDFGRLAFTPPDPEATNYQPPAADPDDPRAARVISFARDASFAVDGLLMSSASNTIDDVIEGVSLTLKKPQSAEDIANANTFNLVVAEDRAGVKANLQKFVDAYNKLIDTTNSLTRVTQVGGDSGTPLAGPLVGDATVRSFLSAMRTELGNAQGSGDIRILADLGITTKQDGKLEIDSDKLDQALERNFDQVQGFLTGEKGLMGRLEARAEPYIQTGGILEQRTKSLQTTLKNIDKQREDLDRRMSAMETRLFAQFNAMDMLVGQLSQTSQYLENQLSNLPGVVRQDRKR